MYETLKSPASMCVSNQQGLIHGSMHQAIITWTNIDFSSEVICGIHLRGIWQEVHINLVCDLYIGQVTELRLSCYPVLLSTDSKTR